MKALPPGPVGGYKKGGRPIKPRVAKEVGPRQKIERPWLKLFPTMIHVDWSNIDPKKVNVLYAGRAARLRNRLRNHPLNASGLLGAAKDYSFEIHVWNNPEHSIEQTTRSRPPDLKLSPSEFKQAPDGPAVYVWTTKPKKHGAVAAQTVEDEFEAKRKARRK